MGKNTWEAELAIEREAANEKARETRERNRSTGLSAEKIYIDRERVRTEFLGTTQRDLINETSKIDLPPLILTTLCPLPGDWIDIVTARELASWVTE